MNVFVAYGAPARLMRPYTGIGLTLFHSSDDRETLVPLYQDPGLLRIGVLDNSRRSVDVLIFGVPDRLPPLIVSARKGDWVKVTYDDAGREAWIDLRENGFFQTWESFLKRHSVHLLPGLQTKYYQLQQYGGNIGVTLSPEQSFKVLRLEASRGLILVEQSRIGWVRWCDDDGRLTVGIVK
ncbi:MAG: hypothetical protein PHY09_01760 [Desulfuromonadaceae bacterium]|nr:hypothetical protein [Desulfuromonadaceae bacterium]MDD5105155.1 hypothetical protein [Desulfuromonadaceae bacterium]